MILPLYHLWPQKQIYFRQNKRAPDAHGRSLSGWETSVEFDIVAALDAVIESLEHIQIGAAFGDSSTRNSIGGLPVAVLVLGKAAVGVIVIAEIGFHSEVLQQLDVAREGDGAGPEIHAVTAVLFGLHFVDQNYILGVGRIGSLGAGQQVTGLVLGGFDIPFAALFSGTVIKERRASPARR